MLFMYSDPLLLEEHGAGRVDFDDYGYDEHWYRKDNNADKGYQNVNHSFEEVLIHRTEAPFKIL